MTENNGKYSAVTNALQQLSKILQDEEPSVDSITAALYQLYPAMPEQELRENVTRMKSGVDRMMSIQIKEADAASKDILLAQTAGMTEEQAKGCLTQLFDFVKASDAVEDPSILSAVVDGKDLAQMPIEELTNLVAEQISHAALNMTHDCLQEDLETASIPQLSLKSENDALLLAASQYLASLDGSLDQNFARMPELLGACAAAQAKIVIFTEQVVATDLNPDEKMESILNYVVEIFTGIIAVGAVILIVTAGAVLPMLIMTQLMTVFGTGLLATIIAFILSLPIAAAAILATAGLVYGAGVGIHQLATKVLAPRFPKFQGFYAKLYHVLFGTDPFAAQENEEEGFEETAESTETSEESYEAAEEGDKASEEGYEASEEGYKASEEGSETSEADNDSEEETEDDAEEDEENSLDGAFA
jgi:hypothetical protein